MWFPLIAWVSELGDWLQQYSGAIQAIFAGVVAVFTGQLAWLTIRLWRATKDAADAAKKSADTAERAFTVLERPYLFVFGVTKFVKHTYENHPSLDFSVGNYGKSPAIIEEAQAQFSVGYEPEPPLGVEESSDLLLRPVFSAGETRHLPEKVPPHVDLTRRLQPVLNAGRDLFYWVIIYYRGPFTSGHKTSACWRYYPGERVFVRFGGDEYNYTK